MTLPKPLVLFLAFCGGAAIFGLPLVFAALAFGAGGPAGDTRRGCTDSGSPAATASATPEPR